jgi:hypothetical protein
MLLSLSSSKFYDIEEQNKEKVLTDLGGVFRRLQKEIKYVSTRTLPQALSHDVLLYESDSIRC